MRRGVVGPATVQAFFGAVIALIPRLASAESSRARGYRPELASRPGWRRHAASASALIFASSRGEIVRR